MLSSSETRADLGRAAQNTATMRFSAAAMARQYLSLYDSITMLPDAPKAASAAQ
jgi:hypothetical protein